MWLRIYAGAAENSGYSAMDIWPAPENSGYSAMDIWPALGPCLVDMRIQDMAEGAFSPHVYRYPLFSDVIYLGRIWCYRYRTVMSECASLSTCTGTSRSEFM